MIRETVFIKPIEIYIKTNKNIQEIATDQGNYTTCCLLDYTSNKTNYYYWNPGKSWKYNVFHFSRIKSNYFRLFLRNHENVVSVFHRVTLLWYIINIKSLNKTTLFS